MAAGSVSSGRVAAARPRALVRRARDRPDLLALAAILFATFVGLMYAGRSTLPYFDDWIFWADEASFAPGYLLEHYNGHASPVVKAVWNFITVVTGGDSFGPYRLIFVAMHVATMWLFYVVAAPRVGRGVALVFLVPLAFMGNAWLDYVMPISGIYQAAGTLGLVAAVAALERDTRRGDIVACVALTLATFSAVAGVAAVAGAFAWLLWPEPRMQLRRLWVPAIPTVLFTLWYAVYSPEDGTKLQPLQDASLIPGYVADGFSHGVRTFTYLPQDWSVALAAGLVLLVIRQALRPGGVDRALAAAVAAGVAYWAVVAIGRGPELRVDQFRYLYPNAVHVALIAVLVLGLAGLRSTRRTTIVLGVVAVALAVPSANALKNTFRGQRELSLQSRAAMTAVNFSLDQLPPSGPNPFYEIRKDDGFLIERYRAALARGRDLAYSASEVPGLSERQRQIVDKTSLSTLGVKPAPVDVDPKTCTRSPETEVPPGGSIVLTNRFEGGETVVLAKRFADNPSEVGRIAPRTSARIEFPRDRSDRPWQVTVNGAGVNACPPA